MMKMNASMTCYQKANGLSKASLLEPSQRRIGSLSSQGFKMKDIEKRCGLQFEFSLSSSRAFPSLVVLPLF